MNFIDQVKKLSILLLFSLISLYFFKYQVQGSFIETYYSLQQQTGKNELDSFLIKNYGFSFLLPDEYSKNIDVDCPKSVSPVLVSDRALSLGSVVCVSKDSHFFITWSGTGVSHNDREKGIIAFVKKNILFSSKQELESTCVDDYSFPLRVKMPGHITDCVFTLENKKYYFSVIFFIPNKIPYIANSIVYFNDSDTKTVLRSFVKNLKYIQPH